MINIKHNFNNFDFAVTGTKHEQYILNYICIFMQILVSKDQYLTTYCYFCNQYSLVTFLSWHHLSHWKGDMREFLVKARPFQVFLKPKQPIWQQQESQLV